MAGRGAAPAGLVATRHSGGIGAPPGTTRSPCQELADVSRRRSFPTLELKRGPLPQTSQVLMLRLSLLLERVWRAARRPRAARHEPLGLCAFSARHPPHTPDAEMRRGKETACLVGAP